jgi:hypothetical protein
MMDKNPSPIRHVSVGSSSRAASYPAPAFLRFSPGGISYAPRSTSEEDAALLSATRTRSSSSSTNSSDLYLISSISKPETLIQNAREADDRLRKYCLLYSQKANTPHFLPSLSALAEAAFGRLTGCPPERVREWADAMVCQYANAPKHEQMPTSEDDIWNSKPAAAVSLSPEDRTAPALLRKLLQQAEELHLAAEDAAYMSTQDEIGNSGHSSSVGSLTASGRKKHRPRPCGYVFKRGDIAWNCRTCQTDATCVICDDCFRHSDHEGHEVYFHRTTPGGCCDCGDAEAWLPMGCCEKHRPLESQIPNTCRNATIDDPMEAVRAAETGYQIAVETLQE